MKSKMKYYSLKRINLEALHVHPNSKVKHVYFFICLLLCKLSERVNSELRVGFQ